ncbi:MAG: sigma 54-interacting transcriptional regulator [Thermodesulfobacteriota bacterium]
MSKSSVLNIPPDLLEALLNNPWDAHLLVDENCIVRFLGSSNEEFYGVASEEIVGKHLSELNPGSGLPRVLKTGVPEIGKYFKFKGKQRVVSRIPLRDQTGKIIGAVGKLMFWHPEQVKDLLTLVEVLEGRLEYYEKELKSIYRHTYTLKNIIGECEPMREAKRVAVQAAKSQLGVLITGETGTGKEILAQTIHQLSERRNCPFVKVNCAAIPFELIESELFGYEAGAFTGASRQGKPGKFELSDSGTIFLDEVGDMPLTMQAKLLRVLQEHEVERVGGTKTLRLDFRVIAATNRDLKAMIQKREFRQDLYYRLNIFQIVTPPLRLIRKDIPRIAYYLLSKQHETNRDAPLRISPEAMRCLMRYDWPGNVRELGNVLERASVQARGGILEKDDLGFDIIDNLDYELEETQEPRPLKEEVAEAEIRAIRRALGFCQGNRSKVAKLLNIHRTGLYQKMKRYGLEDV